MMRSAGFHSHLMQVSGADEGRSMSPDVPGAELLLLLRRQLLLQQLLILPLVLLLRPPLRLRVGLVQHRKLAAAHLSEQMTSE